MSKILKSTTLGNVKNGGIFKALGKEFVKLDADEHGCLVLAKDIWTKMPFRDGDDPECPNDLRRSDVMKYLGNCLAEFTEKGTPLDTFIPFKIDLQDTTGQTEFWEKMYPGYTLHYCEPIITGNNTRHLIVRLYRKETGMQQNRRNRP